MRHRPNKPIDRYRVRHPVHGDIPPGANFGYFLVPTDNGDLRITASDGTMPEEENWEHVSVSLAARCPTWLEMQHAKEMFWGDTETVLQFHPKGRYYVNAHPFCLHLWRQRGQNHKLPPRRLI